MAGAGYQLTLDTVSGAAQRTGYLHYCCWPCVCDTQDFVRLDTRSIRTKDGISPGSPPQNLKLDSISDSWYMSVNDLRGKRPDCNGLFQSDRPRARGVEQEEVSHLVCITFVNHIQGVCVYICERIST